MALTVRIADITPKAGEWPNLLNPTIPGLPEAQVARVIATEGTRQEGIVIIFPQAAQSLDHAAVVNAVRAHLKDYHVGYVESNQTGVVHVWIAESSQPESIFLIAAAAAVLQRSWGWDDSPSIRVSVGEQSFCFQVEFTGDRSHQVLELTAA